ncbi:MAG TPA: hypothetical protein VGR74_17335 [Actinomycetota bacterium]|nr:hypothetical protein [Actinomycetota bacterium]
MLSIGPIQGVSGMLTAGESTTFSSEVAVTGPYANFMDLRVQLGAKPSAAFPYPGPPAGSLPEWDDDHKLSGLAAAWWALKGDPKVYANGVPEPLFITEGPKVYDPRADDTYPGGAGTQRPDDDTTWSFAGRENPYLQAITWCLGYHANGKRTMGMGLPLTAIDLPAFVDGANVYEANAWAGHGGVVYTTDRKWDVLTAMLQAGGGEPMRVGGKISCVVNAPKVSLATLTGADLAGDAEVTGAQARRDRFNRGVPRYRSEDHAWEMVAAAPVEVSTYITEDGGVWRTREFEFPLVQDKDTAAQLTAYKIADSREFGPIVLPLKPRWRGVRGGDCITVDEPELGLNGQKVLILTREMDPSSGAVTLVARSETDAKHPFALGRTGTAPPSPGLTGVDAAFVPTPQAGSWTASGGVLTGADGTRLPAIIFTGGANEAIVQNVIAEWRLSLGGGLYGDWVSTEHPATITRIEARGLLPRQAYHCRIRYRTVRQIEDVATALDLGLVTTGSLNIGSVTEVGGRTVADVLAAADAAAAQGRVAVQSALELVARTVEERTAMISGTWHDGEKLKRIVVDDTETFEADGVSLLKRLQLIGVASPDGSAFQFSDTTLKVSPTETWGTYSAGIAASFATATAAILTEQSVRSSADSAFTSSLSVVTANVSTNAAAIVTESTARATADSAFASSLSTVSTTVSGHTSSITTLQSAFNGISAQYLLVVDAGTSRASIQAYAGGSLSSLIFSATNIGFTNGTSDVYPFSISGSKVHATNLVVNEVEAGSIVTGSLVGGAVSTLSASTASPSTTLTGSGVTMLTHSHTSTGGEHAVQVCSTAGQTSAGVCGVLAILYADGVEIGRGSQLFGDQFTQSIPIIALHTPGAGSVSYTVTQEKTTGSTASAQHSSTTIVVTELKR